jgi:hypothetical protein
MKKIMDPINRQICHFCVAGNIIPRQNGQILKLPVLTIDVNTNTVLDVQELFCKKEMAELLKELDFKKGDYGYVEGNTTFAKGRPSDIQPVILKKLSPNTVKFQKLDFDEVNNVLYTYIDSKRINYNDVGEKIFEGFYSSKTTTSKATTNYQNRVSSAQREMAFEKWASETE